MQVYTLAGFGEIEELPAVFSLCLLLPSGMVPASSSCECRAVGASPERGGFAESSVI